MTDVRSDAELYGRSVKAGFAPGAEAAQMVAVILAESGGDAANVSPPNHNGTTDRGLAQVNSVHGYDPALLLDPDYNLRAARAIFAAQGWRAWSVYKNGRYLPFMARGLAAAAAAPGLTPAAAAQRYPSSAAAPSSPSSTGGSSVADLSNPLSGLGDLGRLFDTVASWDLWRRWLMVLGGAGLMVLGLAVLDSDVSGMTRTLTNIVKEPPT